MKNKELWAPTKFVKKGSGFKPSNNPKFVQVGSYFISSILANVYQASVQKYAHGVLLDLGCGNVPLYEMYKDYILDNICIDWSNTLHENPYLDYEFNLNNTIPLDSNLFDTVLATDVIEHIAKPRQLIEEIARLLKPQGYLILTVPFLYWLHETPHDYFRYTEFALKMLCEEADLSIISIAPYGGAVEVMMDIIAKLIMKHHACILMHRILSKAVLDSNFFRKKSLETSKFFPLGYCLIAQKKQNLSRFLPISL